MNPRQITFLAMLVALYIVVGQVVRFIHNPMVPGAIIALNMIVIVIAGILLGPAGGALVGLLGTALNGFLTPAGNAFERAAIVPHTIMGLTAGFVGLRSVFAGALCVLVGHSLNILSFILLRLMPLTAATGAVFFSGLLFETVVDVVLILMTVGLLQPIIKSSQA
jgi:uncharacterized membrane protein